MAKNEFTLLARVSYLEAAHRLRDEMEGEGDLCFLGSPGQLCLLCNDVFAWASADAEPLPENLFDQYAREWIDLSLTDEELQWYAAAWAVRLRAAGSSFRHTLISCEASRAFRWCTIWSIRRPMRSVLLPL